MDKKNVAILVILTNVISVSLVLLFMHYIHPEQEKPVIAPIPNEKPDQIQQVNGKPKQTTKIQIDSIFAQYDIIKSGRYREYIENYKRATRKTCHCSCTK
jgi:hypothetical protein